MLVAGLIEASKLWAGRGNRLLLTSRPYGLADEEKAKLSLHQTPLVDLDAARARAARPSLVPLPDRKLQ